MSILGAILRALGCHHEQRHEASTVDVAAKLDDMAAHHAPRLEWRTSIVDLLKLLDIDSSYKNRIRLAHEMGYREPEPADPASGHPVDMADDAAMNVWLHKRVMQRIADNGGQLPPELLKR